MESIFNATGLTTWAFSQKNLSSYNQTYVWNKFGPPAIVFTEYVLAAMFADGLSRVGSFTFLQYHCVSNDIMAGTELHQRP